MPLPETQATASGSRLNTARLWYATPSPRSSLEPHREVVVGVDRGVAVVAADDDQRVVVGPEPAQLARRVADRAVDQPVAADRAVAGRVDVVAEPVDPGKGDERQLARHAGGRDEPARRDRLGGAPALRVVDVGPQPLLAAAEEAVVGPDPARQDAEDVDRVGDQLVQRPRPRRHVALDQQCLGAVVAAHAPLPRPRAGPEGGAIEPAIAGHVGGAREAAGEDRDVGGARRARERRRRSPVGAALGDVLADVRQLAGIEQLLEGGRAGAVGEDDQRRARRASSPVGLVGGGLAAAVAGARQAHRRRSASLAAACRPR